MMARTSGSSNRSEPSGNQEADCELYRGDVRGQVEIEERAEEFAIARHRRPRA